MPSFRNKALLMLTALFALFIFAGDLAADELCKVTGACCTSETQESGNDHDCPACMCAVQSGSVVRMEALTFVPVSYAEVELAFPAEIGAAPDGVRAAIDHPPQLA